MNSRIFVAFCLVFVLVVPYFVLAKEGNWNCPYDPKCGRRQVSTQWNGKLNGYFMLLRRRLNDRLRSVKNSLPMPEEERSVQDESGLDYMENPEGY
ncbi:hypothetical protein ACROYT_G023846 [Oculina patagonica]